MKNQLFPIAIYVFLLLQCSTKSNNGSSSQDTTALISVTNDRIDTLENPVFKEDTFFTANRESDSKENIHDNIEINKVTISLDNFDINGLKYHSTNLGVFIDGFDIDQEGNYYFLTRTKDGNSYLSKFSNSLNPTKIWEQKLENGGYGKINHESDSILILLDEKSNSLVWIRDTDGTVLKKFNNFITNKIVDCNFLENTISCELYNIPDQESTRLESGYALFDFYGNLIGSAKNLYDLDEESFLQTKGISSFIYDIETFDHKHLKLEYYKRNYYLITLDSTGSLINETKISEENLKLNMLPGKHDELIKIVNGVLNILTIEKFSIVIYKLGLK